ncbi:glutamate--cysteine ligase [Kocuria palustris]|uniref:glutamate--cysteine ligase n=1 Tax=Kocuria palustris TaxID=71999 RepID=UPI001643693F|nr:glutamate--cysteine ligase [Kocuria palustris]
MNIEFSSSPQSTLGVEWEVALVDAQTGALVPRAEEILAAVHRADPELGTDGDHPIVTGEFLSNTVEMVTGVCRTVEEALAQFEQLLEKIRRVTDPMGVEIHPAGTHPFSRWQDQAVVEKDRYFTVLDRAQYWGRQMVVFGMHVHIGVDAQDKALPVLDHLLAHYAHLLALSANSPYWNGFDTGYASHRAQLFQQLPTAGIPDSFRNWAEFEHCVSDLLATGVIDDISEYRLDVRPVPKYGTVEMRFCDSPTSTRDLGAIVALTQCLAEEASRMIDAGRQVEQMRPWLIRENKWRAARYGLEAIIIRNNSLEELLVTDDLAAMLERLQPIAADLGCVEQLADVARIVAEGTGSTRQREAVAAHDGDLRAAALDVVQRARRN